jgi:hypothetical protein
MGDPVAAAGRATGAGPAVGAGRAMGAIAGQAMVAGRAAAAVVVVDLAGVPAGVVVRVVDLVEGRVATVVARVVVAASAPGPAVEVAPGVAGQGRRSPAPFYPGNSRTR